MGSAVAITLPLVGDVSAMSFAAGGALSDGDAAIGGSVLVDVFTIITTAASGDGAQVNQCRERWARTCWSRDTTSPGLVDGAGGVGGSTGTSVSAPGSSC